MFEAFVTATVVSHLVAAAPFFVALFRHRMPRVVDFACVSILAYDDIGLALDAFAGLGSPSKVMMTVRQAPPWVQTFTLCLVLAAPWLLRLGASLKGPRPAVEPPRLSGPRYAPFVFLVVVVAGAIGGWGLSYLLSGLPIWVLRAEIGTRFGGAILVFYLPMYLLAYFLTLEESKTSWGLAISVWLTAMAMLATAPIGERTLLLAPLLMLGLFRGRPSLGRLVPLAIAGVVAAALLLPHFKWQFERTKSNSSGLVLSVLHGDFNRSYTLGESAARSPLLGTSLMAYPLAGYVYTAALFVPRSWAPFKGQSTALTLTAAAHGADVDTMTWSYGIGFLEEAMLNVGLLFAPFLVVLIGWGFALLDAAGEHVPGIAVPVRVVALWSCGYDSAALLMTYGGAVLLGLALNQVFSQRRPFVVLR